MAVMRCKNAALLLSISALSHTHFASFCLPCRISTSSSQGVAAQVNT